MNTRGLILLGLILALLGAGAYFAFRPSEEIPLPSSPTASSTEPSTLEDIGAYHEISVSYPSQITLSALATPSAKASAEAVVKAWANETVATFKANANLDTLTEEDIRIQGLDMGRKYTLDASHEEYTGPHTVSYLFQIYEDTLGAHPNAYYRSFTFDANTGKELRIADVFESPTYLETLSRISREMLIPQIAEVSQVSVDELDTDYIETGTMPDPNNFQVFYFTSTDLVIVFPPYQVGPWVLGTQTVSIPRAELEGELKATYK
jgi:hypothetical protein